MSELDLRGANFFKMFSMFLVMLSLLYMYGYVDDRMEFLTKSHDWISKTPKAYFFYFGLGFFALFNLLINLGISMYKRAEGFDENSKLFKNKEQKRKLLVWFTYFLVGVNFLISCIIFNLALIRINEVNDRLQYIYIPTIGLVVLLGITVGLLVAISRK